MRGYFQRCANLGSSLSYLEGRGAFLEGGTKILATEGYDRGQIHEMTGGS